MQTVIFNDGNGWRPGIAKEGTKVFSIVHFQDSENHKVTVSRVPKAESRYFRDLDYDPKKAARRFRKVGVKHMTKQARAIIEEVLS